jgi:L-phenylalanine/L-methionine N-acetyltransferase
MSSTRITIRPLRFSDAEDIYELMHMPNVLWGSALLPSMTVDAWRKRVEKWVADELMHVFVVDLGGKVVGAINLRVGQGRESHVGEVDMAVHDAYQGQGIGKMLLLAVIDLADNWLNLVRLEVNVYTDNERAINLYKRFDFEIEGRKRCGAFRRGSYIDSYIMGRLRPQGSQAQQAQANYADTLTQPSEAPKAGSAEVSGVSEEN